MAAGLDDFAVGLKIDFLYQTGNTMDDFWFIATIIEVLEHSVKVHYDCDGDRTSDDTWIEKISDRIAPLNTYTLPLNVLSAPICDNEYIFAAPSKPFYFVIDNQEYIFLIYTEKDIYPNIISKLMHGKV